MSPMRSTALPECVLAACRPRATDVWNDQYVAAYQAMTGWSNDHMPFPGAAARRMRVKQTTSARVTAVVPRGGPPVVVLAYETGLAAAHTGTGP
jgi:hypothetical protein